MKGKSGLKQSSAWELQISPALGLVRNGCVSIVRVVAPRATCKPFSLSSWKRSESQSIDTENAFASSDLTEAIGGGGTLEKNTGLTNDRVGFKNTFSLNK